MKKLYLVRHGETLWNLEKRTQGHKDSDLTPLGIEQANLLANRLKKIEADIIYSSPLKRAYSTGKIISDILKKDCVIDNRLKEMSFGIWEGLSRYEIQKKYPELHKQWRDQPHKVKILNAENFTDVQNRIKDFLNQCIIESDKEVFVVVSHGVTIRLLLLYILSMDLSQYYKLNQDNCAINLIEFRPYGPVLGKYNDTCHMDI